MRSPLIFLTMNGSSSIEKQQNGLRSNMTNDQHLRDNNRVHHDVDGLLNLKKNWEQKGPPNRDRPRIVNILQRWNCTSGVSPSSVLACWKGNSLFFLRRASYVEPRRTCKVLHPFVKLWNIQQQTDYNSRSELACTGTVRDDYLACAVIALWWWKREIHHLKVDDKFTGWLQDEHSCYCFRFWQLASVED
jgi:hypothetical protein